LGQKTFERFNRVAFDGKLASVGLVWSKKLNKTAGITRMGKHNAGQSAFFVMIVRHIFVWCFSHRFFRSTVGSNCFQGNEGCP